MFWCFPTIWHIFILNVSLTQCDGFHSQSYLELFTSLGKTLRDIIDRETCTDNIEADTAVVTMIPDSLKNVKLLGYLSNKQQQAIVRNSCILQGPHPISDLEKILGCLAALLALANRKISTKRYVTNTDKMQNFRVK